MDSEASRTKRILIVDDNDDMRVSMKLLLERAGYEVALASNGTLALEAQRRQSVDILISDLFMPETDGFETIQKFKKEFPAIKIVAMSSDGGRFQAVYLETARTAGADALLRKPFTEETLLKALAELTPAA